MCRMSRNISLAMMVLIAVGGCPFQGLVYEEDMVGGYAVWATDVIEQAAVVLKVSDHGSVTVVPPMVCAYGWNDDFIIAKRRPTKYGETAAIDANGTSWYIVQVPIQKTHGPLNEDEFAKLRATLQVPSTLSFTRTLPPRGASQGQPSN